jgi:hypothetical protein
MLNPLLSSMLTEARRNDLFAEAEAARKVAEAKAAREGGTPRYAPPRWRERALRRVGDVLVAGGTRLRRVDGSRAAALDACCCS